MKKFKWRFYNKLIDNYFQFFLFLLEFKFIQLLLSTSSFRNLHFEMSSNFFIYYYLNFNSLQMVYDSMIKEESTNILNIINLYLIKLNESYLSIDKKRQLKK